MRQDETNRTAANRHATLRCVFLRLGVRRGVGPVPNRREAVQASRSLRLAAPKAMVKKQNGQVRSKVPFAFLFHGNLSIWPAMAAPLTKRARKGVILTLAKLNVLCAIRRKINQTDQPRHRPCLSACRGGVGAPAAQETDRRRHDTEVICAFRCASQPSAVQQR
jgi:hypothetical protein